jgi:MFS superfamily sulfate permease-like transporter
MSKKIDKADWLASVVVFLVALPLCMGIAIASGVPPARGLVTGVIGGIVTGLLAGSPLQVSGPAAGLAVLVYELVQTYGLAWLGVAVLGAGILQWVAGYLGLGRIFQAVSPSVVKGMLAGIGVLIFASQFHVMVDDKPRGNGLANLLSIPEAIAKGLFPGDGSAHHLAALIGMLTLSVIILWENFRPRSLELVPAPLVAVTLASLFASLTAWPILKVQVPTAWSEFVALPDPALFGAFPPMLLVSMLALAFIASAETLLCATAVDSLHDGQRTDYNQELKAQGIGNALCGLLGGLPMTGVIVRSSANLKAGGKTRYSAVLHGVWLAALVLLAPGLLALIPTAALAAILVYIGYKLVDVKAIKKLREYSRWEVSIYVVTLVSIVVTDLLTGVMAGLGLSILRTLLALAHLDVLVDTNESGDSTVTLKGAATFVSIPKLSTALEGVPRGNVVTVKLDQLLFLDHACKTTLEEFAGLYERQGGTVSMEWKVFDRLSADKHLKLAG